MMMYLSGADDAEVYNEFAIRMTEFMSAVTHVQALEDCVTISRDVMSGEYYKALSRCRKLMEFESERLSNGSKRISDSTTASRNAA
jgi:flagellar protein FlbT